MSLPPSSRSGLFTAPDGRSLVIPFALVSTLFMLWGFCNGMIDVMDKHFQDELHLTLAQSASVQFAHYLGYFFMALPAGWLAAKLGYKTGIITGLLLVAVGGFWFIPATQISQFWAFLAGVCLIAAGLTFLETIANPYTTVLGPSEFAATRINLAQSCNGIGWILGPLAGRTFFYARNSAGEKIGATTLWIPYAGVAVVVILLAVAFYFAPLPDLVSDAPTAGSPAPKGGSKPSLWSEPHFVWAVVAQFFYVAAQAGIFSFFINYMVSQTPGLPPHGDSWLLTNLTAPGPDQLRHLTDAGAASLASLGFFCFLAGRFSGAAIMRRVAAHRLLCLYGGINVAICLLVVLRLGWFSVAGVFVGYFFMSIMFPTIFALGIHGLGERAKQASAFLVMAIIGGAILPKVMGAVGDRYGLSSSFLVPLACFLVISAYGWAWPRLSQSRSPG